MPISYPLLFLISSLACATLLVAGVSYYFRSKDDALANRLQELQEQAAGGGMTLLGGDFWDSLLRSTYGAIFGKTWFRQKEMELMRAGYRGPRVVKVYGIASLAFTALLLVVAVIFLRGQDLSMWLLGIAAAFVVGYFIPEQILTSLRNRHRLSLMAAF